MKMRLWVLITVLLLAGTNALIGAGPDTQWLGVLWTKGSVTVGDAKVSSGTTVLPGDVITTAQGASAWLRFRSPASTILLTDTQVALLASNSAPSFVLRRGTVVVDEQVVDPVHVAVPGGYVLVKGDPQTGAECEMAAVGNAATVSVARGLAEIHSLGAPLILHAGQSARVEAGPQGGQPVVGRIDKELPQGVIQRQGESQEITLNLNEIINCNDVVRTLQVGRAEILLLDGSTLDMGALSTIKITKHDPQAQQTQIEMPAGEVKANVQKVTAPGGKFELRTKSAVIGTIDTSFLALTDDKGTRVCGVEGITLVGSTNPLITKTVKLHVNECTVVLNDQAPTDPVLSPGEVASWVNQMNIQGGGLGQLAASGGSALPWLWIGIAGGGAAAVAGIVLATSGGAAPTTTDTRLPP
jgi:ferric-dicitrate binding protein FerR (iron transport regulator)